MSVPEGWRKVKLREIADVQSGGTPSRKNRSYWQGGTIPWVTTAELCQKKIFSSFEKITHAGLENSSAKIFNTGTLLVAMYGQGKTRGQVAELAINAATNQACAAIRTKDKCANTFLFQVLAGDYDGLRNLSNSGSQKNLSLGLLNDYAILLPPFAEQKKIAAILSTWDKAIAAMDKLLENARQQKKALMQQLLTGKERLPGFSGKWESVRLNTCYLFLTTANNPRSELVNSGDYKYIHYGDIHKSGDIHWDCSKRYLPEIYKSRLTCRAFVRSGDLIVTDASEDYCGIAKSVEIIDTGNISIISGLHTILMRPDSSKIALFYSGYILKSQEVKLKIQKSTTGISVYSISKKELGNITVDLPPLPEQQAIARVLTTADKEIDALTRKVALLRQEKRALMQQLLTGKKRVQVEA